MRGKKFSAVTTCCPKKCYENILIGQQNQLFDNFYALGIKSNQDLFLSSCILSKDIKTRKMQCESKPVETWEYSINVPPLNTRCLVCREFLLKLLQITPRRIRTVQAKVKRGSLDFKEKRGTHDNRPTKIPDSLWTLVQDHWASIPHSPSHYAVKKSKRLYFYNSELTVSKLFSMFKEYYLSLIHI